jgi:hypothetical protein
LSAASQATIDGLPEQVGEGKLCILPAPGIRQALFDEIAKTQSFIHLAHQEPARRRK